MPKPQQPELARSGYGEATAEDAAKRRTGGPTDVTGNARPVPEDNLPGHHPEEEQDKPKGPPPRPRARRPKPADEPATVTVLEEARPRGDVSARFRFAFEPRMMPFSLAFGVSPWTSGVEVADGELRVRFGPWSVKTPLDNVEGAEVTGPYQFVKVAGPAHLSLADRGVTFATTTEQGVCIRFRRPVSGAVPGGLLRHPAVTVTVEDPEALVEVLTR